MRLWLSVICWAFLLGIVLMMLALGLASKASAGELVHWPSVTANIVGQAADSATTIRFLHNGSACVEGNRFLGEHPSTTKVLTYQAAVGIGAVTVTHLLFNRQAQHSDHPRFWHVLAQATAYTGGAVGFGSAFHNIRMCGV